MKDKLLCLLEERESAPSAVHYLAETLGITLDYEPYEANEWTNDRKRDELINQLSTEQMSEMVTELESRPDEDYE